jgi:hypothetical protein
MNILVWGEGAEPVSVELVASAHGKNSDPVEQRAEITG